MRIKLFPFQEKALEDIQRKIENAHRIWTEKEPQAISFSAPTGSGKTIIMTALFEEILRGSADRIGELDSIFIWLSDSPYLNEQTRMKIESKSDKIPMRNLITIDSNYDAEFFDRGCIYFINTQKLATDKLLTLKSDVRQYTIWETITNTSKRDPKNFYVVIDEAHRGAQTKKQAENAQSIMQKFIKGSPNDGLCIMPLVIGVTATPKRFNQLMGSTPDTTTHNVNIPPEDVRESGLLKEQILIHYPNSVMNADLTLFKNAVENWRRKCDRWKLYCEREGEKIVRPLLVVQVEDASEQGATRTDIGACIDVIENALGRKLILGEAVQTFHDQGAIVVGGAEIRHIEASRIEEDETATVVFFKMNLSTGWDCPRAETMMSFRKAQDYTYIAQLLGRMVRTPLARRINSDEELNNVSLFLPYFNEETVKSVVDALRDSEAVPIDVCTSKQSVTLSYNSSFNDVRSAMGDLVTYRLDTNRKMSPLRMLMQLSRLLTINNIDSEAQKTVKKDILNEMAKEIARIKEGSNFEEKKLGVTGVILGTMMVDYGGNTYSYDKLKQTIATSEFDINRNFEQAGNILGEGLHKDYWKHQESRNHTEVMIEVIILSKDIEAMEYLNEFAGREFDRLYDRCRRDINRLNEKERINYDKLARASVQPVPVSWNLPDSIDFSISEESETFDKHMYCFENGSYKTHLNSWEKAVVEEELKNGAVCWLRNIDRKKWALEIPYRSDGVIKPMFPDLIVVHKEIDGGQGYIFDILEPHNPDLKDNLSKAVGLAEFAGKHDGIYGRIQIIRKLRGSDGQEHLYRLDLSKRSVRNKVLEIATIGELDRIFEDVGFLEESGPKRPR